MRRKARLAVLALAAAAFAWGFLIEPSLLTVNRTTIVLAGWPKELDGLTVAVLSDIHAGAPWMTRARIRRLVETANGLKPDLTVLLGDYVIHEVLGGRFIPPEETAAILSGLKAPSGTWAVLGNHDWWLDGGRVRRAFDGTGIRVLENEAVRVKRGGAAFWVLGLADQLERNPDATAALKGVKDGEPVLALIHEPDAFPHLPARLALTLAGHTHGGQVRLPLIGAPIVPSVYGQRYARGLIVEDGRSLFVTTGIGTSIYPVRFGVRPEIALLTLRAP